MSLINCGLYYYKQFVGLQNVCRIIVHVISLQNGIGPLQVASEKGHDVLVNTLLKFGAIVHLTDDVCIYINYIDTLT